ncbi:MAG: PHP domain-containing protein [Thermodesulfobacteriota bacterium]
MEADLHIHTNRYSGCSNIDPVAALKRAKQVGLEAIALTEHGIRWPDDQIAQLLKMSGVNGLLVVPGQEVACYSQSGAFQGEFLVFGYPVSLGSNKSIERVIELVHGEGGIVIAAHPFKRLEHGNGFYGSGFSTSEWEVDGLEIDHPSYDTESRAMARKMMAAKYIAGLGCSDAHDLDAIGVCRTIFETAVDSVDSLVAAIRFGRMGSVMSGR